MDAAKHSQHAPARQIALAKGAAHHRTAIEAIGWKVVSQEHAQSDGVLLVDLKNDTPGELETLLTHHAGPVVAILGAGDAERVDALIGFGVRQFAPADDAVLLRASLEAAIAGPAISMSREDPPRRRRQGDNGAERLIEWIDASSGKKQATTLIFADFSSVEHINAAHGPHIGDLLLSRASRRLAAFSRRTDMVGASLFRISGSRFCLAVPQSLASERITFLLNELLADLHQPYLQDGIKHHLPAALASIQPRPHEQPSRSVSRGLTVLDRAQKHSPAIEADIVRGVDAPAYDERQIEKDLRHAIGRGEIEVVYQPQFAFDGDRLVGAEALARWNHDKYGPLGAGVLFSVASRSEFLLPLSRHIHERALHDAAGWTGALAGLRLSVNVTPQDLGQPDFARAFLERLKASSLEADRLTVEITETGLMRDVENNAKTLAEFRRKGIKIAVDDFGTGYSSLAWLKELPLDYLKLDQGLTADMLSSVRGRIIVQSVIALGRALGLTVTAEGVESEELRALLADEGCDIYQGFLRAAPMSMPDFAAFAQKQL